MRLVPPQDLPLRAISRGPETVSMMPPFRPSILFIAITLAERGGRALPSAAQSRTRTATRTTRSLTKPDSANRLGDGLAHLLRARLPAHVARARAFADH